MIDISYYGTLDEADAYFGNRLHEYAWTNSDEDDHPKALWAATLIIDALAYKGIKTSEDQVHEFPRNGDTEEPEAIRMACYEIAHSLLDGKDPEMELENLGITSQKFGVVSTSYDRNKIPIEHIINGIPSARAWRQLKPFLRDDEAIKLNRVS